MLSPASVLLTYKFTLFSNNDFPCKVTVTCFTYLQIYTILKRRKSGWMMEAVLLTYKFTLFSNGIRSMEAAGKVLLTYKFTLFSNGTSASDCELTVLLTYKFTLFSNE